MADKIALRIAESQVSAGSAVSVSADFRTRSSGAASTPSSIRYRVDCLTNHRNVINWTSVSAASSATIAVGGTYNAIIDEENDTEQKQLTVEIDTGLSTQSRQAIKWTVRNIRTYVPTASLRDDLLLEPYYPITGAETSAGLVEDDDLSVQYAARPVISLERYGLAESATGATNRTAIERAVDVAGVLGGAILQAPAGTFTIDATTTIDTDNVVIRGVGRATIWRFDPSSTDVLFDFDRGANSIWFCGVEDCQFYSTNSTNKTAIRVDDGRTFYVRRVVVAQGNWQGSGSIGVNVFGRECVFVKESQIICARPVVLGINPNFATIHTHFFAIEDCILGSTETTGTATEIETGVNISNLTMARVAHVLGKWGIKWIDTTSTIDSYAFHVVDCRFEQADDATGYCIEINSTAQDIKGVFIDGTVFDPDRNGVKLRKAESVSIDDCLFNGTTGRTNLDVTFQSTTSLKLKNTFVPAGSTVTLTSGVLTSADAFNASETVISKTATYRYDETAVVSQKPKFGYNSIKEWSYNGTLANNGTLNLPLLEASHTAAIIHVSAYSATGPIHCGGSAIWTKNGALTKIGGSANFVVAAVGVELRLLDGGSGAVIVNVLGQDVTLIVDIKFT